MTRLFLIALILSAFSAFPSAGYSQVIVKDFQEVGKKAKVQTQNVTTVQSSAKLLYVADIKKLSRTIDLPPEERKAFDEASLPDTLYIKKLKQQDQLLFQKNATLKTTKSNDSIFGVLYSKRWLPAEKEEK